MELKDLVVILLVLVLVEIRAIEIEQAMAELVAGQGFDFEAKNEKISFSCKKKSCDLLCLELFDVLELGHHLAQTAACSLHSSFHDFVLVLLLLNTAELGLLVHQYLLPCAHLMAQILKVLE